MWSELWITWKYDGDIIVRKENILLRCLGGVLILKLCETLSYQEFNVNKINIKGEICINLKIVSNNICINVNEL